MIPEYIQDVIIRIHSIEYPAKFKIIKRKANEFVLEPDSVRLDYFIEGTTAVLLYRKEEEIMILSAEITSSDIRGNSITVVTYKDVYSSTDRRELERIAVSLAGDVRRKFGSKRYPVFVRNVSSYGAHVKTPLELEKDDDIDIDVYIGKHCFYMSGKIQWIQVKKKIFDYGISLSHCDAKTKLAFENLIYGFNQIYINTVSEAR